MNYQRDDYRYIWQTPDAFLEDALRVNSGRLMHDPSWTGQPYEACLEGATKGNISLVPQAEALLDSIEADLELDSPQWENAISGAYPDVPAFLSGDPECMRARMIRANEKAPVRVFVCTTSSCGVSAETLLKRGIAALALVMLLIRQGRPVELWTFTKLDGDKDHKGNSAFLVRMPTTPVDIARIAHCLSACSFDRTIAMEFGRKMTGFTGSWAKQTDPRKLVNASPSDIVLGESRYGDEIVERPLDWIRQQLAKLAE